MKTRILYMAILILALGTIILCYKNFQLRKQVKSVSSLVSVDTVYIDKPFKVSEPLEELSIPSKVKVYKGLEKPKENTTQDSIIEFELNSNKLDVTSLHHSDSTVHTNTYQLDTDKYKYLFTNGILTKDRVKLGVKPYTEVSYRPLNNMWDLKGGIYLNTSKTQYRLGINLGYYPNLSSKVQKDIEISIQYKF